MNSSARDTIVRLVGLWWEVIAEVAPDQSHWIAVASLFPGTDALAETQHLVVANWVEQFHTWRLTLTAPVLNHARHVIFLVAGADKAEALQAVLQGAHDPQRLPAQLIRPVDGDLLWLVDRAAAQLLADDAGRSLS